MDTMMAGEHLRRYIEIGQGIFATRKRDLTQAEVDELARQMGDVAVAYFDRVLELGLKKVGPDDT